MKNQNPTSQLRHYYNNPGYNVIGSTKLKKKSFMCAERNSFCRKCNDSVLETLSLMYKRDPM